MSQGTPIDADTQQRLLQQCETCLGYVFQDQSSLLSALTHASSAEHRLASNERLEFLGDAILGMVVCEILYLKFPDYSEGDLTRVKSVVVSRQTCARISARLGLERFLILGKGMAGSDRLPSSLLADVFESLIAAIYLDGGYEPARQFVERELAPEIEAAVRARGEDNYKSQLQQLAQRDYGSTPVYQLLDESGPDHSKCFQVAAQVGERQFAPAWGRNKKEAEQLAARHALIALTDPAAAPSDSTPDSSSPEAAGCPG
jgi:ribonuclease III